MSDVNQPEVPQPPTPETPPVPQPTNGAEMLIANASKAIEGAHDAVVQHIDDMIAKLQSVKQSVQIKKEGAVAQLKEFVNIAASGLETVKSLEVKIEALIKNHL